MNNKWKLAISILTVLTLSSGIFLYFVFSKVGAFFEETYKPIETNQPEESSLKNTDERIHVLLMGVDERPNDKGRPDVIMVMELNPKTKQTKLVSVPRDTKVQIPGKNEMTKLNHAYTFGDVALTVQTVQKLLEIKIEYYAKVNMDGFENIIDKIGPLTVENELAFSYKNIDFPVGTIELSSEEVLPYVRMRKDDPLGDEGRNIRQRKVVNAAVEKVIESKDYLRMVELLDEVSPYLEWNVQDTDFKTLFVHYLPALNNIELQSLSGEGELDKTGVWYFVPENPSAVFHE
ncbi:LCP family protein required for cell wall assembly [Bacillus pakistanensis]|uniref:LCP family protein required for cell wall assembly n=1 Tax=Rossellomorea pakistanensis TaxID=992288 RepID=A0ABS2NE78_9BACI|nr:LCP family protein [Bacillus pakistanensis]MBM7586153.1 LCP family protein required for cell wall assembly [Bacillus pakistanensis]